MSAFAVHGLTGDRRHRKHWSGKLVLQVQEHGSWLSSMGGFVDCEPGTRWRDATIEDLTAQGIAARSDETQRGSAEGKSPVPTGCAQPPSGESA